MMTAKKRLNSRDRQKAIAEETAAQARELMNKVNDAKKGAAIADEARLGAEAVGDGAEEGVKKFMDATSPEKLGKTLLELGGMIAKKIFDDEASFEVNLTKVEDKAWSARFKLITSKKNVIEIEAKLIMAPPEEPLRGSSGPQPEGDLYNFVKTFDPKNPVEFMELLSLFGNRVRQPTPEEVASVVREFNARTGRA